MAGMIVGVLVTGGAGILIAWLGWLVWKKEKLTLLHDYHTDKVSPENRPAFCKRPFRRGSIVKTRASSPSMRPGPSRTR